ncbi:MAG: DNA cytosine methyltransferase, partial [Bradyrhizobium sp.]
MNVVSLFSGAGGIDYGFEAAGFETRVCVDFDRDACATIRNSRSWPVIEADIMEVSAEVILQEASLSEGDVDVLIGGPPCQPFSKSGFWSRGHALRLDDPRAGTLRRYLEIVRAIKPRTLMFENVDAISYAGKDEGLQLLLEGLHAINISEGTAYRPFTKTLDAAEYGVPQHRTRFFLVASRDGLEFKFPHPTHGVREAGMLEARLKRYSTAWDA